MTDGGRTDEAPFTLLVVGTSTQLCIQNSTLSPSEIGRKENSDVSQIADGVHGEGEVVVRSLSGQQQEGEGKKQRSRVQL